MALHGPKSNINVQLCLSQSRIILLLITGQKLAWIRTARNTLALDSEEQVLIPGLFLTTKVVLGMSCNISGLIIFIYK